MRKQAAFNNINGMNQDVSISKFNPKMIYEGMNIRINSSEDGTLFSITNEKGNKKCIIWNFDRTQTVELNYVVGHCVLNDWLVIFDTTFQSSPNSPQGGTGDEPRVDRILRLEGINDYEFTAYVLYESDGSDTGLNFRASELIECFGLYESDDNQKVYFCDRNNPIRFINIMKDVTEVDSNGQLVYDSDRVRNNLNFCPVLKLEETYDIQKRNYGGTFHSGVIQYAFSYWNLNGQETHIHYVTPLYYISFEDRAGSPEQTCSNSFRIEIDHLDSNFDYLRIYCIHRTTEDAMPNARIVSDIYLRDEDDNPLTFADIIDDGIIGRTFDSNLLPVLGGDEIFAETMATKEGVLFAGNIRMFNENLEAVKDIIRNNDPDNPVFRVEIIRSGEEKDAQGNNLFEDVEIFNEDIKNPQNDYYMYYPYTLNKPSDTVKH
ncbi:MAG: hypothetical protein LBE56_12705 [Tannerella sp.]|jgi:hypothetical protein|nr:hypothetical protein [Tannerella sp.]